MSVAIWVGYPRSYTSGRARPPQFVVLHYTAGSEGPTSAENGADYDKRRTDGTSTHYFVDSSGPALQEVPDGDRAHAALYRGNEIGIHIEICGTLQTRAQWLDPTSYATLVTTAALTREICDRHGFQLKQLNSAQTRAAYYDSVKPTGITDHGRVTAAFPEDGGNHTDVGTEFPWDVFMEMVTGGSTPQQRRRDDKMLMIGMSGVGGNRYWVGDGIYHREVDKDAAERLIGAIKNYYGDPRAEILSWGTTEPKYVQAVIGAIPAPVGGGAGGALTFDQTVEAARQGAEQAEDS